MKHGCILLSFAAGFGLGWMLNTQRGTSGREIEVITSSDTILLRDTIRLPSPSLQSANIIRVDTLRVASDPERDTIFVPLPITQVHYKDTIAEAWVSGFRPRLDSLHLFPEKTLITTTLTRKAKHSRWHLGAGAGITVTPAGLAPGVTIGITYSFMDL